jgi:hypothetical protein
VLEAQKELRYNKGMTTKEFLNRPNTIYRARRKGGYGRNVYLYVNQASNGPIFAYGLWSPRVGFTQYGWTNSAEDSIAAVEKIIARNARAAA